MGENQQIIAISNMDAADEPRALCIIRDMSSGKFSDKRSVMNLPSSFTASQMMDEVAKKFQYSRDTFELVLNRKSDRDLTQIHKNNDETLLEMGFQCSGNERNNLILMDKNSRPPTTVHTEESGIQENGCSFPCVPPSDFSCNLSGHGTGFVGLVNQAMTCYLNSFLQTLFMTPEFQNTLYRWEFDGTEEDATKSIPFQLQKLFLLLQTSKKPAVGTIDLTTSFGWDSSEAWQQHDVQELCRVMFDALEQKFKNTEQADLISRLYEGKLKDYVKCLECGHESAREDTFLDVPLVVRPFGSTEAYTSVEEALHAFVSPETLQGSNQYFCEHCQKKCDAHKGLKFLKFPYLLTLQLKRFDFDPATMHRIKLNDRVSFPEFLAIDKFLESDTKVGDESSVLPSASDDDEGIDMDSQAVSDNIVIEESLEQMMAKGYQVYELFSIMVHSGSANGGHYYAYIKSFKNKEWYCFNDAQVTSISEEDIKKTYGGGPSRGYYSSAYSSSTNAYMLMYRLVDQKKNADFILPNEFPEHIRVLLQCMQEQEERERLQKELDHSMCKMKVFCLHPTQKRSMERKLKIHKDCTLLEATRTAHTIMGLEGIVPVECCRLVRYDDLSESLGSSFDGCNDTTVGEILNSYYKEFFLEIKQPHELFQEYKAGGTTLKVHVVDLETEDVAIHPSLTIRSHPSSTVAELKDQIAQSLNVSSEKVRMILDKFSNDFKYLDDPTKTLEGDFKKSHKIFVEYKDEEDCKKNYAESKLLQVMNHYVNTICIHVVVPTIDKANPACLKFDFDGSAGDSKCCVSSEDENGDQNSRKPAHYSSGKMPAVHEWVHQLHKNSTELECDEGLGDSEVGDTLSASSPVVHSDQSEDSSLTDTDRTLVGSPCSDCSDKRAEDKPECDSLLSDNCENCPSPEKNAKDVSTGSSAHQSIKRSIRVWPYTEEGEQILRVYVDKRITLAELKKELEPHIGVKADGFKLFRVYRNWQLFEWTRLNDTLASYGNEIKLSIQLGRALRKGEHKVKIHQLIINEPEPSKFLLECVVRKGMTVLEAKKEILPQLKETCSLSVPLNRCRLRKKNWKNPGSVYFDHQRFETDIPVNANWEMFLEVLTDAETVVEGQTTVFSRRWHPAAYVLDPFKEVVVEDSIEGLLKQLSEISGLSEDCIEFAKGQGTFPCEVSLLTINRELEWQTHNLSEDSTFQCLCLNINECPVIYYRDKREELKKLSEEELCQISEKEKKGNSKSEKSAKNFSSPRKEKALKIYTVDSFPNRTKNNTAQQRIHDLD